MRNIKCFGNIGESVPEFAIGVYKDYRNNGIGKELMRQMLILLKEKGYTRVSLSV